MSDARRESLDEPRNGKLIVMIQANSHLELLELSNVLLHLEVLLAKKGNPEGMLLLV